MQTNREAKRGALRERWNNLATDQLRRVGAVLATQGEVLAMVAQGEPLEHVLESLCLLVESEVPSSLCSVLLEEDGKLVLGAAPNLPESYACGVDGLEIGEGFGPCASAAVRKEEAIYGDIASSNLPEEVKRFILDHDVKACWSIPIFGHEEQVVGTFGISLPHPEEPSEYQADMLKTAAYLAGIAINRERFDQERSRLERDLMHRQKLESLGLMAGGIAHDFNNLLTAISGCLSLLNEDSSLNSSAKRRVELARKASDAATDLTTEMLTYAGLASVELGDVDLGEEIRGVLDVVGDAKNRGVSFSTLLDEECGLIHGDASQLRQVVHNLVQNAIDALPSQGGQITVWLHSRVIDSRTEALDHTGSLIPAGSYLVLGVEDTGRGIEAAQLAKIFDPFFSSKRSGRGLGLAMVLGGARAHDGYLHVQSQAGCGTTIQVFFPERRIVPRHDAPPKPDALHHDPEPELRHLEILLVEDEWSIRELVEDILVSEGWTVYAASDGLEGWRQWREHPGVDAVILDRCMPGLSGDELVGRIRREAPHTPIIVSSGFGATSLAALRHQGVSAVLPKPFTAEDLLATLLRITGPRPSVQRAGGL